MHPWFAIRVGSNYERTLSVYLRAHGYEEFLPIYRDRRQWSDRVQEIEASRFSGYVFCRMDLQRTTPILSAPGVVHLCGRCRGQAKNDKGKCGRRPRKFRRADTLRASRPGDKATLASDLSTEPEAGMVG